MRIPKDQYLSLSLLSLRKSRPLSTLPEASRHQLYQARNGIYHCLPLLKVTPGSVALVPAYLCRAAVDPLTAYGLSIEFYNVNADCSIDLNDLERRLTPSVQTVLAVHYFGFPQSLRKLRQLCTEKRVRLIEDCAHVLVGDVDGQPMGSVGDAAVFSWRKFLPISDGADLVMTKDDGDSPPAVDDESLVATLRTTANLLEVGLAESRSSLLNLGHKSLRLVSRGFKAALRSHNLATGMANAEPSDLSFNLTRANWPMSRPSRWIINHSAIDKIVLRRRRNYQHLSERLSKAFHLRPLFPVLPDGVCPWVFPIRIPEVRDAHLILQKWGIPAVNWAGVRHPLWINRAPCEADRMYNEILFIPIHQNLSDEDIAQIAARLASLTA